MEGLGFDLRDEAVLQNLTEDVVKSSEIEGEKLDRNQVRSSIARRLGINVAGLVRSERERFYSMSAQICTERKKYYEILESTQKGGLDITDWIVWFLSLSCKGRALQNADHIFLSVMKKVKFWELNAGEFFNERQRKLINRLLDGFDGNMTAKRWAAIGKCSHDTANRDIQDLIKRKILKQNPGGGRSTSYLLAG